MDGFPFFTSSSGGITFLVPLMEGVQGEDSDCSGSNPYNNHLRHFVTPPPAEDIRKVRRGRKFLSKRACF